MGILSHLLAGAAGGLAVLLGCLLLFLLGEDE